MGEPSDLMDPTAAREEILRRAIPLPAQMVTVEEAIGRALASEVRAVRTLPPWDNSAMDGFAVRHADLSQLPVTLKVVETVYAGGAPKKRLGPGEAARVMTGAPVPEGTDLVIMQEKTRFSPTEVELLEGGAPGQNVRAAGEDAREGEVLLEAGAPLGIPEAALLYAQGIRQVEVPARPRVALLATGDELVRPGEDPRDRIVDTNSPSLALAAARAGGVPTVLGVARDDRDEVFALFERARGFDVVLSSAGVSVGDKDFVRDALDRLGVQVHFWRVAIKPGKPLLFGTLGRTLFFGLPGNPASSLVTFELFVRPALRAMAGHRNVAPPRVPGVAAVPLKKPAGLTHYLRATVEWRDGALWATPLGTQTSGVIRSTALATHLLVFPRDSTRLDPGQPVELVPVSWTA